VIVDDNNNLPRDMPFAKRIITARKVRRDGIIEPAAPSSGASLDSLSGPDMAAAESSPNLDTPIEIAVVVGFESVCCLLLELMRQADDLFNELSMECRTVLRRTERINVKVANLTSVVSTLNAKAVHIRK